MGFNCFDGDDDANRKLALSEKMVNFVALAFVNSLLGMLSRVGWYLMFIEPFCGSESAEENFV